MPIQLSYTSWAHHPANRTAREEGGGGRSVWTAGQWRCQCSGLNCTEFCVLRTAGVWCPFVTQRWLACRTVCWGTPEASHRSRVQCLQRCVLELSGTSALAQTSCCLYSQTMDCSVMDQFVLLVSPLDLNATGRDWTFFLLPGHVPRSEIRQSEETPVLFLPILYLLLEQSNNFTFLPCWSEVFLKHQIHTEKINDSSVMSLSLSQWQSQTPLDITLLVKCLGLERKLKPNSASSGTINFLEIFLLPCP